MKANPAKKSAHALARYHVRTNARNEQRRKAALARVAAK